MTPTIFSTPENNSTEKLDTVSTHPWLTMFQNETKI